MTQHVPAQRPDHDPCDSYRVCRTPVNRAVLSPPPDRPARRPGAPSEGRCVFYLGRFFCGPVGPGLQAGRLRPRADLGAGAVRSGTGPERCGDAGPIRVTTGHLRTTPAFSGTRHQNSDWPATKVLQSGLKGLEFGFW